MNIQQNNITCWIITEGIAGTENQCIGVAEAMGIAPEIKRVSLNFPWNLLSPFLGFEQNGTFSPALRPPWPDLLIASGRKSIAAARYIKKKSGGKTFTVFIQNPKVNLAQFDLVAAPAHDQVKGDNIIVTTATPNRISEDKLQSAKNQFDFLSRLPSPRVAVLIGGNSKTFKMDSTVMTSLARQLSGINAGLMVTASRRTGEDNRKILEESLKDTGAFIWDGTGENPYFGMLAWADYILVTADSASMLSEAATTGKPVYIIDLKGGSAKFDRLHQNIIKHGAARKFTGNLEAPWEYTPLNDSEIIAQEILDKLKIFQK